MRPNQWNHKIREHICSWKLWKTLGGKAKVIGASPTETEFLHRPRSCFGASEAPVWHQDKQKGITGDGYLREVKFLVGHLLKAQFWKQSLQESHYHWDHMNRQEYSTHLWIHKFTSGLLWNDSLVPLSIIVYSNTSCQVLRVGSRDLRATKTWLSPSQREKSTDMLT